MQKNGGSDLVFRLCHAKDTRTVDNTQMQMATLRNFLVNLGRVAVIVGLAYLSIMCVRTMVAFPIVKLFYLDGELVRFLWLGLFSGWVLTGANTYLFTKLFWELCSDFFLWLKQEK